MEIDDIFFDEDDQNIFLVDDLQLKADALRHSTLPKLEALSNHLIDFIRDIYSIEPVEDSSFTLSPHFRQHNRVVELKKNYTDASIEISGRRTEGHWPGLAKPDGKPISIVPFGMNIGIDATGIQTMLYLARPTYTKATFKKFFDFTSKYTHEISAIINYSNVSPWTAPFAQDFPPMTSLQKMLEWSYQTNLNKIVFEGKKIIYPISPGEALRQIFELVYLFPVYDSFIQIAKGKQERFMQLYERINEEMWESDLDAMIEAQQAHLNRSNSEEVNNSMKELAEKRIKVMPSMRWQVFQRDNWRCVACGHNVDHDITLHVDHVIPRSKGGKNEICNYQTLCNVCNIGKSNKNDTNIKLSRA